MVERRRPLLDEAGRGPRDARASETVHVDRPPVVLSSPHAFPWVSSLAIGWSAVRARLFPARRVAEAAPGRDPRGERD